MRFHPSLAPFKACILPLSKKLSEQAGELYAELSKHFLVDYDEAGSIGKRYRRQDEIGTPFCITYDFDSVEDGCVTVRDRDTMEQERIKIDELVAYIEKEDSFLVKNKDLCGRTVCSPVFFMPVFTIKSFTKLVSCDIICLYIFTKGRPCHKKIYLTHIVTMTITLSMRTDTKSLTDFFATLTSPCRQGLPRRNGRKIVFVRNRNCEKI